MPTKQSYYILKHFIQTLLTYTNRRETNFFVVRCFTKVQYKKKMKHLTCATYTKDCLVVHSK